MNKEFKPSHRQTSSQPDGATPDLEYSYSNSITLDIDWLRSLPQCAHYTDKRAAEIIAALSAFGALLIEVSFLIQSAETPQPQKDEVVKPSLPARIIPLKLKKKAA